MNIQSQSYKYLIPIAGLFSATLIISNVLDTKIFVFFGLNLPAGIILFPLAYLFGDVLTEVYGYSITRRVIWTGFVSLVLLIISLEIVKYLPSAAFWTHQESYESILGHVPRIAIASIAAYFAGEFTNSFIVAKMKVRMKGRFMGLRFIVSTLFGQLIDTCVFVAIAFVGVFTVSEMVAIIISAWLVKVAWEVLALPATLYFVKKIKLAENVDFYDTNTNFNPFSVGSETKGDL